VAVIASGAALAVSLGNRDNGASTSDLAQLREQVTALQQQVSGSGTDVQGQVEQALQPVRQAQQQLKSIERQQKANSAAIKHIDAYLKVHAPGYTSAP
jgi:chromosome segregation ATPase